ncbi:TPA: hypothetical protein ACT9L7_002345 [Legionella pneumophila]|uniref:terminase small subunit-like protein n=1 Tax=Legionella pneumophila TaxID=446 RepID=UPI002DD44923|nr:hypothetical protein [Legionella pneumophila]
MKTFPLFSEQYAQAKICQIELLVDEILEIADDLVLNNSAINRARLKLIPVIG